MADDEFPEIGGYRPSVKRSEIDQFTEDDAYVLLHGAGDAGHGYHSADDASSVPGKTPFPRGWAESDAIAWLRWIVDHPQRYHSHKYGFDIYGSYKGVEGIVCIRQRHGVTMIQTAFPLDMLLWKT